MQPLTSPISGPWISQVSTSIRPTEISINSATLTGISRRAGKLKKAAFSCGLRHVGLQRGSRLHYYSPDSGLMLRSSWKTIDGHTYYFNAQGNAVYGLRSVYTAGPLHFFDYETNALLRSQSFTIDGLTYRAIRHGS